MKEIMEVKERTPELIDKLLEVWESSVRATHLFLSDSEIDSIKEYVPQAMGGIAHLIIAGESEDCPVAFMGIEDGSLEIFTSIWDFGFIRGQSWTSRGIRIRSCI